MKELILKALGAKYASKGVPQNVLEAQATYLATVVQSEDQIENVVNGVEPIFAAFISETDRRVTSAVDKATKKVTDPAPAPTPTPAPAPAPAISQEMQALMDTVNQLKGKLESIEINKTVDNRKTLLESKLAKFNPTLKEKVLKDFSRMQFGNDDDFNTYVSETETALAEADKAMTTAGLSTFKPFTASGAKTQDLSEADKSMVDNVVKSIITS